MKTFILAAVAAAVLCGCAGKKPPKPRGSAFPINVTVQEGK